MGRLISGEWITDEVNSDSSNGHFARKPMSILHEIDEKGPFQPTSNRYHLYVSYACPWAHRTLIFRHLKKLCDHISVSVVHPLMLDDGWSFAKDFTNATGDDLHQFKFLREIYTKSDSKFTGKVTVPILWDKETEQIVNHESSLIIRILNSAFNQLTGDTQDFYPKEFRGEIDEVNELIYENINNGVYRCGFAKSQEAYEEAYENLFCALDKIEKRLDDKEFLVADRLTEADLRLFPTLIRFDAVYHGHFKCNKKRLTAYPNLLAHTKRIYDLEGVAETVHMDHIKYHYYASHRNINPSGVVPLGPEKIFE